MDAAVRAVSFDLFDTLLAVDRPDDPAAAVAQALEQRAVPVPDDWPAAYRESHCDVPPGAALSLPDHVTAALASRDVLDEPVSGHEAARIESAVQAAFDTEVRTRAGAVRAVRAAREIGPVGVLSNCSVPGLVTRSLSRSELDPARIDAVVTSVGCGWRKPDERAFAAVATRLGVPPSALVHVGDDPRTDGHASAAGATAVVLDEVSLQAVPAWLEDRACPR